MHYNLLKGTGGAGGTRARKVFASDNAMELIFVKGPGGKGKRSFSLKKGRIFEAFDEKNPGPFKTGSFPQALIDHGTSKTAIFEILSKDNEAEARKYFEGDGKDELEQIIKLSKEAKKNQSAE